MMESQFKRRKSVRLGRSFAGSLAVRLDAHPISADGHRREEERRVLELMREVLMQPSPDPCSIALMTQAVEMYTKTYGLSKAIHDELFRLQEARAKKAGTGQPPAKPRVPTMRGLKA
jgi:hypothetical protein